MTFFITGEMSNQGMRVTSGRLPEPGWLGSPCSAAQPSLATAAWGTGHTSFCPLMPQGL